MTLLARQPGWMFPLPEDPPQINEALTACVSACRGHRIPTGLCRQCLGAEMEQRIVKAARLAQSGICPAAEDFAQVYFEHPGCVGGEDTLKLFLPYGLKLLLPGRPPPGFGNSSPEVVDTLLRAGFWFWPADLTGPARTLAARLFLDWFTEGHYGLEGLSVQAGSQEDFLGIGDEILQFCMVCLIDPADLYARLGRMHTPQADDALRGPGNFAPVAPSYISAETSQNTDSYKVAADAIASSLRTREAHAFLSIVTPEWLKDAHLRNVETRPDLAACFSEVESFYDILTINTREEAGQDILSQWPALPTI